MNMQKNFVVINHTATKRIYLDREVKIDKADVAEKAIEWELGYWDGSRGTGYGGYYYDGRWKNVAKKM